MSTGAFVALSQFYFIAAYLACMSNLRYYNIRVWFFCATVRSPVISLHSAAAAGVMSSSNDRNNLGARRRHESAFNRMGFQRRVHRQTG
jgi:hypothetical protein